MRFLLPFKGLNAAKSRWGQDAPKRSELVLKLVLQNLKTVADVVGKENVFVVCPDANVTDLLPGFQHLKVDGHGLNQDLTQASEMLPNSDEPLGVLLPDLHSLKVTDIKDLITLSTGHHVVLCPDEEQFGTNCLAQNPAGVMPFLFEGASFERHLNAAQDRDLSVAVLERPGLAQDCDDLEALKRFCLI